MTALHRQRLWYSSQRTGSAGRQLSRQASVTKAAVRHDHITRNMLCEDDARNRNVIVSHRGTKPNRVIDHLPAVLIALHIALHIQPVTWTLAAFAGVWYRAQPRRCGFLLGIHVDPWRSSKPLAVLVAAMLG